jgi:hypothetical protein
MVTGDTERQVPYVGDLMWVGGYAPDPSGRTGLWDSCSLYQKCSPESISGINARPAREAHSVTAICERIVWTMWDPGHLTNM